MPPTWEQLLSGIGVAVPLRSQRQLGTAPRHVRSWSDDWADEWAAIVQRLRVESGMSWREASAWTALAATCAAAVTHPGLLH